MYCGLRLINSAVSLPASLGPRLPAGRAAEGPPSMALLFCFQAWGLLLPRAVAAVLLQTLPQAAATES